MDVITEFNSELIRLETGSLKPVVSLTESEWRKNWIAHDVSAHGSLAIALIGGALADRLAWVFHSGYQGMMRYAFPFCPGQGWASYLVAEDKTGEHPGTTVTESGDSKTLSGYKSWVAAADHVDHMVVKAQMKGADGNVLVLVDRNAQGVVLSSRSSPGFLADLSQGFAAFDQVSLEQDRIFGSGLLPPNFAQSEPHHVLTALNAFMISHTVKLGGETEIMDAAIHSLHVSVGSLEENKTQDSFLLGIADLDAATTETAKRFEDFIEQRDSELYQRWQKDRGLVTLFSRGLQKRATKLRER
jgi:hypothetical protein